MACSLALQSCNDEDTYADKRKRENANINSFLKSGTQILDDETGEVLLDVPGQIKTISEATFHAQDCTTSVENNEYVYFGKSGVYMQILDKGEGKKMEDGDDFDIIVRYIEYNIASDTIQTTNHSITQEMQPDIMSCSRNYGVFSGSVVSGKMYSTYASAAVPAGWLIPLEYINLGRDTRRLAHVRLIVPSTQGHANASANVYACFYDLTLQRGRR